MEPERCLGLEKKDAQGKNPLEIYQPVWVLCTVVLNRLLYLYWPTFPVGLPWRTWLCFQGCISPSGHFKQKRPFLNKAICCAGVLSLSITQKHIYKHSWRRATVESNFDWSGQLSDTVPLNIPWWKWHVKDPVRIHDGLSGLKDYSGLLQYGSDFCSFAEIWQTVNIAAKVQCYEWLQDDGSIKIPGSN